MSYIVFARKYRPMSFDDVVAQEHVTKTLQNGIKNDRIGQGYLFCGPRGTGKTTTARILAKAVNCVEGPTPNPCGKCPACEEITKGVSLDVLEIDAASNTGVYDIRTIRENVRYMPTSGHKRIYIIDEVHRLSASAFDALLKTLEEPPPHVMFIFATTEPLKVPETILSRTQRFDFKLVSIDDLTKHLKKIADSEKLDISQPALRLVARKANGSVRDSLSLLDQIAAFADGAITEENVIEALGLVDKQLLFDFTNSIAEKDKLSTLKIIKTIFENGVDSKDFVAELLEHLRILLVLATDKSAAELLNISSDDLKDYLKQAENYSVGDIIRLMKIGADMNNDLKFSGLDERLILEMNSVKMAEIESTVKFEEVLAYLKKNPIQTTSGYSSVEKKKSFNSQPKVTFVKNSEQQVSPSSTSQTELPKQSESAPVQKEFSNRVSLLTLQTGWKKFLSAFNKKRPMLASQLGLVQITDITDNTIIFTYPASCENSKQIVEKTDNFNIITETLRDYFQANFSIRFCLDKNSSVVVQTTEEQNEPKNRLNEIVANSERIQNLLKKVDGKIVGIKQVT